MFDNKDILIEQLRSPLNIASMTLTELEERLGNTKIIADPNTPFCHLLEFGSSITAAAIGVLDEKLPVIYPQRAITADDLYHHMSDFDYLRMYSSPASTTLRFSLPKKYLKENALPYNDNYKQVTLPKDAVFMLGRYPFGIYYPINILINNYTNSFTAVYDTHELNPLHTLTTNVVDKSDFVYNGIEYVSILFPVYQFAKSTVEESLTAETGFAKKYIYNNKFYAVRLFSYRDGVYTELHQSQSKMVYDSTVPTALIRVLPDEHKLKIVIPQIYFDNNQMGSKLYIEIYTTLGQMDVNTTNISGSSISVNFGVKSKDSTDYSSIFKNLPFDSVIELASSKILGGTDAIDVATLRERVVNDTLYEKVPITEEEISNYLEDNGFYVKKYLDNVTDRIYLAYRVLTDETGSVIPSLNAQMLMKNDYVDDHSTFIPQSDGSITVLPTTVYEFNTDQNCLIPITDEEMQRIGAMDKEQLVDELNSRHYFRSPFHLRINLQDYYPETTSYNLMLPEVQEVMFDAENYNVSARMTSYEVVVDPLNDGVSGYHFQISVSLSDDLVNVDRSLLKVYVTTKASNGTWIGIEANYDRSLTSREVYSFDLLSNYRLTEDDELGITNLSNDSIQLSEFLIPLTAKFYIVFLAHTSALTGSYEPASTKITEGVPAELLTDHIGLYRQHATVRLGYNLSDVIRNNMEVSSTATEYATWDHNVPMTYPEDVYQTNEDGSLVVSTDEDGQIVLTKLHSAGEQMVDEHGNLLWEHQEGDVRYDSASEPIVVTDREKQYYIDMMFIDAKVFASDRTAELDFVQDLYRTLEGYFANIRTLQDQLLERTLVYFNVVRSTGTATFNYGDGVTGKNDIEMSFRIVCYVPSYVKQDSTIQDTIRERVCDAIEDAIQTKTISMNDIFSEVQQKLSDYIDHFTLLGVNGDVTNQTFQIVDDDAQPSIARKLELSDDYVISLVQDIDISFVALEDNRAEEVSVDVS